MTVDNVNGVSVEVDEQNRVMVLGRPATPIEVMLYAGVKRLRAELASAVPAQPARIDLDLVERLLGASSGSEHDEWLFRRFMADNARIIIDELRELREACDD